MLYDDHEGRAIWFLVSQEQVTSNRKRLHLMKADLERDSFEKYGVVDGAEYANVLYVDHESGYAAASFTIPEAEDDIILIPIKDTQAPMISMREQLQHVKPNDLTIRLFKQGKLIFKGTIGGNPETERDVFFTYELN